MEYNILIIDDSADDVFLFKRTLDRSGIPSTLVDKCDGPAGLALLKEKNFDCIFLDYTLPGMDGLQILNKIRAEHIDTPVVMLTGQKDEHMIVRLMQEGATDYLPKHSLSPESLRVSIENSMKLYLMQIDKAKAEEALRNSEARLAEAQRIAHIGNWEQNLVSDTFFLSDEAKRIVEDYASSPFLSFSRKICQEDLPLLKETMKNIKNGHSIDVNLRYQSHNKQIRYLNIKGYVVRENRRSNAITKMVGTVQDVTELKNALKETQKATIKSKATTIVFSIAIVIFLLSEAILDPFIDSLTASLLISLSFKGSIAMALKPVEFILEKIMIHKTAMMV